MSNDKLLFQVKVIFEHKLRWTNCSGERRYIVKASNTLEASNIVRRFLNVTDWSKNNLKWRITGTRPIDFIGVIAEIY